MAHLEKQTMLEHSPATVRQWLSSPGAQQRLLPAYLGTYPGTRALRWSAGSNVIDTGDGGCVFDDHIDYQEPSLQRRKNAQEIVYRELLDYRGRQITAELNFAATVPQVKPMRIAMSGASGMIGTELKALLETLGHTVCPLVRRSAITEDEISYHPGDHSIELEKLARCDAVINLAGESIFGRFTTKKRQAISTSRIPTTRLLVSSVEKLAAADGIKRPIISASGIGYYGFHASHGPNPPLLVETDPYGDDVWAKTCLNWEATATSDVVRTVQLRLGLVLTAAGGMMGTLLPMVSHGLAGRLGEHLWNSWVSVGDTCRAFVFALLHEQCSGVYNVVNDNPILNDELIEAYSTAMAQTTFLPLPRIAPKLILGTEGADVLALGSQRVSNEKFTAEGFRFSYDGVEQLFAHILPRHPKKIRQGA